MIQIQTVKHLEHPQPHISQVHVTRSGEHFVVSWNMNIDEIVVFRSDRLGVISNYTGVHEGWTNYNVLRHLF